MFSATSIPANPLDGSFASTYGAAAARVVARSKHLTAVQEVQGLLDTTHRRIYLKKQEIMTLFLVS